MATLAYIMKHKENIGHGGLPEFTYGIYALDGRLIHTIESHPKCIQNKLDTYEDKIIPISPMQFSAIKDLKSISERQDYFQYLLTK
jgi:hypothetical protein